MLREGPLGAHIHRVLLTGNQMLFSVMASSNQPWGHLNYTPKEIVKQSASDFYCRHWGERQKPKGLHLKTHLQNPTPAYMLNVHSICLIAKTMEATTWVEFRFATLFPVVKWNILLLQDAPWTQSLCPTHHKKEKESREPCESENVHKSTLTMVQGPPNVDIVQGCNS
jgi:hypothetical protein